MKCDCGAPGKGASGICDDCIERRAAESAARHGLPPVVTDDRTRRLLARIARVDTPERAA